MYNGLPTRDLFPNRTGGVSSLQSTERSVLGAEPFREGTPSDTVTDYRGFLGGSRVEVVVVRSPRILLT